MGTWSTTVGASTNSVCIACNAGLTFSLDSSLVFIIHFHFWVAPTPILVVVKYDDDDNDDDGGVTMRMVVMMVTIMIRMVMVMMMMMIMMMMMMMIMMIEQSESDTSILSAHNPQLCFVQRISSPFPQTSIYYNL